MTAEREQMPRIREGELLAHRQFLDSAPVIRLPANALQAVESFGNSGDRLEKKIAAFYAQTRNSEVEVSGIGKVRLDLRAVRNSRGHGNQPERLAVFVAVPDILKRGRIIDTRPMRNDARGRFFQVAAPLRVEGIVCIGVVQIKAPHKGISRMYVHQVVPKKELQDSQYYRADTAGAVVQTSGQRELGVAETLLREIYSVKSNEPDSAR